MRKSTWKIRTGMLLMVTVGFILTGCQVGKVGNKDEKLSENTPTNNASMEPIIHLAFDESQGTLAKDSKGLLEDGYIDYVYNAAKYQENRDPQHTTTAISGNALIFDGYSTFLKYSESPLKSESLSCSVWLAPRAFEWGDKGVPSTIASQYISQKAQGFQFGIYRFGSYGVELQTKAGKLKLESTTIEDFVPKFAWTQLTFTYDATTSTLSLYKNGIKMMSDHLEATENNPFNPADTELLIGQNNEGATVGPFNANMFDGVLDELKFYDQVLSDAQVLANYQKDLAPFGGTTPAITYSAIALNSDLIKDDVNRPTFHIGAPEHWMNEPHGAFYYKGQYHIFYQHNPVGPYWHQIHWGHLVSTDMIHWRYLPDALAPSYNSVAPDGIWSGSSVLDREGNPVIFFTAGNDSMQPNQNIATARPKDLSDPDLTEWVMSDTLSVQQEHGQGDFGEFRDPYVWYDAVSDYYYMLVGTGTGNEGGTALAYRTYDLAQWTYFGPFTTSDYTQYSYLGQHWELPVMMSFTDANGQEKDALFLSPHGDGADVEVYYFTGTFDRENVRFVKDSEVPSKLDLGNGVFTGPSGFKDPVTGKNILFTIAQGERDSWAEYYAGWAHNGGMPVELTLTNKDELIIAPIKAVESLRKAPVVTLENVSVEEANAQLAAITGDAFDIEVTFEKSQAEAFGLNVRCTADQVETTKIYYDTLKKGLYIDRLHSSLDATKKDVVGGVYNYEEDLNLRILLDRSMIEVYANQERSLTARTYPTLPDANGISLFAKNGDVRIKTLVIYPMMSIYE